MKHAFGSTSAGGWLGLALAAALTVLPASGQTPGQAAGGRAMNLTHACLITKNLAAMREFYTKILQTEPRVYAEDYLEFSGQGAILSLYQAESMEKIAPGAMTPGANRSLMLEFQVADVDREYARLQGLPGLVWVLAPTTFPWGHRSMYLRDPEGNLLNFYSMVQAP